MITLDGLTVRKIVLKQQNGNSYDMDKCSGVCNNFIKNITPILKSVNVASIINAYCIWLTKSRKICVVLVLTNVVF